MFLVKKLNKLSIEQNIIKINFNFFKNKKWVARQKNAVNHQEQARKQINQNILMNKWLKLLNS